MSLDNNANIRSLIRTLLGMPSGSVRPANQAAPTGNLTTETGAPNQFATVLLNNLESRGLDDQTDSPAQEAPDSVVQTTTGIRRVVASIQFFRGDAYLKACRLGALLQSNAAREYLQTVGLGLVKVGPALNLTALVDNYWEERGQVEVEFNCISSVQATLATFGTFGVTVKSDGRTVSNEVIT